MRKRRSKFNWVEYLLLVAGLAAVDYYIWSVVETNYFQIRSERAFDQESRSPRPAEGGKTRRHVVRKGDVVGRLVILRLHVRVMVREGDDEGTLHVAAGHIPSTALPGDQGNVGFAAHRDTFFRPLRNIKANDRILVSTLDGDYEYQVNSTEIVSPSDVSVLKASSTKELTLVTCYPFYYIGSAPKRFIVHAVQISANPKEPVEKAQVAD